MEEPRDHLNRVEVVSSSDKPASRDIPYREAIGCLMYLMIGTRPDLAFSVRKLSQFCENPLEKHWLALKRLLRYLRATRDLAITYSADIGFQPYGYSDSDHDERRCDKLGVEEANCSGNLQL